MDVGKAIYNLLINDATITSYVADRIFPSRYINDTVRHRIPYITYQKVSQDPNNTKNNASEYDYFVYQINVYNLEYDTTVLISERIRLVLDYKSGIYAGVKVDKIFFESSTDVYYDNSGSTGLYGISSDYRFNINRDVVFVPTTPTGLQLWLNNTEGVIEDSDEVGVIQWTDQSDNANNATQNEIDDGNQPFFANNGITFDGINDFLILDNEISLNEFHIFLVVALHSTNTETLFGEVGAEDFLRFGQGGLDNYIRFQTQGNIIDFSGFSPSIATDGTLQLFEFSRASGTTQNVTLTINGTEHGTKANSDTSNDQFEIDALGVRNTINQQYAMDGVIYQVIIYDNVLNAQDASDVRDYLNEKLNIYV